jgi:hypothetical protein
METVKVDIQKLQLLNDRIAQTIEALNQVRMSVHGIQHAPTSPYGQGMYPGAQLGFAQQQFNPYASPFVPQIAPQLGVPQFAPQYSPYSGYVPGLSHTPPITAQTPFMATNGISHTPWDPTWQRTQQWDPTWQRTQQWFPFIQYPTTTVS